MGSDETDPDGLADRLEREADELEQRGAELEERAKDVRSDWERKRADEGVPGAQPHHPDGDNADEETDGSPAPEAPPEDHDS